MIRLLYASNTRNDGQVREALDCDRLQELWHRRTSLRFVFPSGRYGVGILLLRVMTGVPLAAHYAVRLVSMSDSAAAIGADIVFVASAASLVIGVMTVPSSVVAAAGYLWIAWSDQAAGAPANWDLHTAWWGIVCATVIALTGPGAFSLDSVLFGRREIVIAPD